MDALENRLAYKSDVAKLKEEFGNYKKEQEKELEKYCELTFFKERLEHLEKDIGRVFGDCSRRNTCTIQYEQFLNF